MYHDPSSEAILGETLIQIKEVAAQKEQLLEEIQKLSDQLTQEKVTDVFYKSFIIIVLETPSEWMIKCI